MYKEALLKFQRNLVADMVNSDGYKKAKAFGTFAKFVQSPQSYKATDYSLIQYGTHYTKALDKGRGRNENNSGGLYKAIYNWLELKKYGFRWKNEAQRRGMAYAITKKIATKGTYKFLNPEKRTNIVQDAIEKNLPELRKDIRQATVKQIKALFNL